MRAMNDPGLLEEADRIGVDVNPIDGSEVQALLKEMYDMPKNVIEAVSNIFVPKR
jgi:hypothetical protein